MKAPYSILAISIVLCIALASPAFAFSGSGAGTLGDPYVVTTPAQLDEMRDEVDAHYVLGNSLDMDGYSPFFPIGNWSGGGHCDATAGGYCAFQGSFDGQGYTISNLLVQYDDPTSERPGGLFGVVYNPTHMRNVNIDNIIVEPLGNYNDVCCVGAFVGGDDSDSGTQTYENIFITNAQVDPQNRTGENGGLLSYTSSDTDFVNISFQGSVGGNRYLGGLVANTNGADTFTNVAVDVVMNHNNSHAASSSVGGIVGHIGSSSIVITDSYVKGSMNVIQGGDVAPSGNPTLGGFYGEANSVSTGTATITDSYVQWDMVTATEQSHPLVNVIGPNSPTCTNVYYDSDVHTDFDAVGCAATGLNSSAMLKQASFTGFDFVNTWQIQEDVSTPLLLYETLPPPACTPDYFCSSFGTAQCVEDVETTECLAVDDNNACGIPYPGPATDFNQVAACVSPAVTINQEDNDRIYAIFTIILVLALLVALLAQTGVKGTASAERMRRTLGVVSGVLVAAAVLLLLI